MYKDGSTPSDSVINGDETDITTYRVIADNYILHEGALMGNAIFKNAIVDSSYDQNYPSEGRRLWRIHTNTLETQTANIIHAIT